MFTGLVTDIGRVVSVSEGERLKTIRIETSFDPDTIAIGASIACSGPCLTVTARGPAGGGAWFTVDVAAETLARTTAGTWEVGSRLNLERSLRIGDELGGHLVTGHVDGVAAIVRRDEVTGDGGPPSRRFVLEAPPELSRFIAAKGSITLDGTSLTVNEVTGNSLSVLLIPHSLAVTTWGERSVGDRLNLEVDLMARYAARLSETAGDAGRT